VDLNSSRIVVSACMVFARVCVKILVLSHQIIMSNEEADVADIEDHFTDDDDDLLWLDQRELILLVKNNPVLYAKSSKEYFAARDDDLLTTAIIENEAAVFNDS